MKFEGKITKNLISVVPNMSKWMPVDFLFLATDNSERNEDQFHCQRCEMLRTGCLWAVSWSQTISYPVFKRIWMFSLEPEPLSEFWHFSSKADNFDHKCIWMLHWHIVFLPFHPYCRYEPPTLGGSFPSRRDQNRPRRRTSEPPSVLPGDAKISREGKHSPPSQQHQSWAMLPGSARLCTWPNG